MAFSEKGCVRFLLILAIHGDRLIFETAITADIFSSHLCAAKNSSIQNGKELFQQFAGL